MYCTLTKDAIDAPSSMCLPCNLPLTVSVSAFELYSVKCLIAPFQKPGISQGIDNKADDTDQPSKAGQ